ncbi:MAG: uracil-DNA glycosylase [Bacteroidia bacterium]|nr:uracil-DNA glycosylase [Bacteroidia bacterium]NNC85696.1 uracil-DNA glycosylase [Bacteroidia bacterium]NNM16580.1 uracil-DNA glycosylase [Bacteroidia bacterium]
MQEKINPEIEASWKNALSEEFNKDYFLELKKFLQTEKNNNQVIYPPGKFIFSAFNHTPLNNVKVVILGQDPYHGLGQAHGLCFSVNSNVKVPPSLNNIYKELNADIGMHIPQHGNLESWADQGVLLLNATLTVRASQAGSHQNKGWEIFTDSVIKKISEKKKGVVFLLWGRYAQAKEELINGINHYILKTTHPSPFSAHKGFLGCGHFSKANELLRKNGMQEIDWNSVNKAKSILV